MKSPQSPWLPYVALVVALGASFWLLYATSHRKHEPTVIPVVSVSAEPAPPPSALVAPIETWHYAGNIDEAAGRWEILHVLPGKKGQLYSWYATTNAEPGNTRYVRLICGLAGGPQIKDQLDPSRGVWWVGYCHGATLPPGKDQVLAVSFERRGNQIRMNYGDNQIGPYSKTGGVD
jgi:hypothetical protein